MDLWMLRQLRSGLRARPGRRGAQAAQARLAVTEVVEEAATVVEATAATVVEEVMATREEEAVVAVVATVEVVTSEVVEHTDPIVERKDQKVDV